MPLCSLAGPSALALKHGFSSKSERIWYSKATILREKTSIVMVGPSHWMKWNQTWQGYFNAKEAYRVSLVGHKLTTIGNASINLGVTPDKPIHKHIYDNSNNGRQKCVFSLMNFAGMSLYFLLRHSARVYVTVELESLKVLEVYDRGTRRLLSDLWSFGDCKGLWAVIHWERCERGVISVCLSFRPHFFLSF